MVRHYYIGAYICYFGVVQVVKPVVNQIVRLSQMKQVFPTETCKRYKPKPVPGIMIGFYRHTL